SRMLHWSSVWSYGVVWYFRLEPSSYMFFQRTSSARMPHACAIFSIASSQMSVACTTPKLRNAVLLALFVFATSPRLCHVGTKYAPSEDCCERSITGKLRSYVEPPFE